MRQEVTTTNGRAASRSSAERLGFTPGTAVAGIAFHLMDERVALAVEEESLDRARERLTSEKFCPTIKRELWEGMANRERLEWLLTRSKTVTVMLPDGTARLERKRTWL
jgi:hypothetical protein